MSKHLERLGALIGFIILNLVFVCVSVWIINSFAVFDPYSHDREYSEHKRTRKRSEVVQLWYDRQHLDLRARSQCIEDPNCNYFSLRPADNFTGGDTFHPKPWEQKINLKLESDVTHRTARTKKPVRGPSTKFSRQMGAMPEEEKTFLRKAGEHPVVDYWLGNGFGH